MDRLLPEWQTGTLPNGQSRPMKIPDALHQSLMLLKNHAFLLGISLSLLLTLAIGHAWTAHRAFSPDSFTSADDPSMKARVETCHITPKFISVSGWVLSDLWPGPKASFLLTAGDGAQEVSIPYRLQERPDIAHATHTDGNAFHNRYGFTAIARIPEGLTPDVHLNIIAGHTLYRMSHVCRT